MVALGAALTSRSGLATAGPKFVKGLGHRLGILMHTALVLGLHVHLMVVRKADTFA
jgi:hypothetical protein